jgi:hypothetical protein
LYAVNVDIEDHENLRYSKKSKWRFFLKMMSNKFIKIEYMKKKEINLEAGNASPKARAAIEAAGAEDNLILKVSIDSPVFIEDAAPLTQEGIISICKKE